MTNATTFGQQAGAYARGRPGYPVELYHWISSQTAEHDVVWDVGSGSGQAARELAKLYDGVHATDISEAQIAAAPLHPKITYKAAPAYESGLTDTCVDAVTTATAVHWFADDKFWREVVRVGKPNALFCAWTYQLPCSAPEVQTLFLDPVYALIDPYWAGGNRICMAGYSAENLNCPFSIMSAPEFDAGGMWTAHQLVDFAKSWSAHYRARGDGLGEALGSLARTFLSEYGNTEISVSMPLSVLAARIGQ